MRIEDIPALCIGLIMGFYWARVIKLVRKTKRTAGHGANFVPPEPLGKVLRVLWYPTVVLWIIHPLASAFRPDWPAWNERLFHQPIVAWLGVAIAIAAMTATMICWRKMGRSWRMGIDPAEVTSLVVSGPFAYVRHPIYALSSTLMLATVVILPTPLMIVLAIIHIGFLQWEARREERHQLKVHPTEYADYLAHTGRFIPASLRGYVPSERPTNSE